MTANRDAAAALLLLAGFLAYAYGTTLIVLFPGQETEVFSPRTMPAALAIGGIGLSALQLLRCLRSGHRDRSELGGYDWFRSVLLCATMVGYGLLFEPLGFILATALFLAAGFAILGERRIGLLVLLPLTFSVAFWALMTKLLGLYLAPGLLGG